MSLNDDGIVPPSVSCFTEQLIIYQVGVLPSHFYNVLGDKDYPGFKNLLGKAMVLILLNSTVSSHRRWKGDRPARPPKNFKHASLEGEAGRC